VDETLKVLKESRYLVELTEENTPRDENVKENGIKTKG